jgi:hypothetical protein
MSAYLHRWAARIGYRNHYRNKYIVVMNWA